MHTNINRTQQIYRNTHTHATITKLNTDRDQKERNTSINTNNELIIELKTYKYTKERNQSQNTYK